MIEGGDSGPAIVAGNPDESLLLDALRHDGIEMPPKGKLPDAVIADFERWVRMGAPDPRRGSAVTRAGGRSADDRHRRRPQVLGLPTAATARAARGRATLPGPRPTSTASSWRRLKPGTFVPRATPIARRWRAGCPST